MIYFSNTYALSHIRIDKIRHLMASAFVNLPRSGIVLRYSLPSFGESVAANSLSAWLMVALRVATRLVAHLVVVFMVGLSGRFIGCDSTPKNSE